MEWLTTLAALRLEKIVILTGQVDDGPNREDTLWVYNRLGKRSSAVPAMVQWVAINPGDRKSITTMLDSLFKAEKTPQPEERRLPATKNRTTLWPTFKSAAFSFGFVVLLFASTLFVDFPVGQKRAALSGIRLAIDARGKIESVDIPANFTLPEGADPAEIFGGSHYPLSIRIEVEGEIYLDETYQPAGISRNGRISGVEYIEIEPGNYQVQINLRDDDQNYRQIFSDQVEFLPGQIILFEYLEESDSLILR